MLQIATIFVDRVLDCRMVVATGGEWIWASSAGAFKCLEVASFMTAIKAAVLCNFLTRSLTTGITEATVILMGTPDGPAKTSAGLNALRENATLPCISESPTSSYP